VALDHRDGTCRTMVANCAARTAARKVRCHLHRAAYSNQISIS
jgi:hypothetical protein